MNAVTVYILGLVLAYVTAAPNEAFAFASGKDALASAMSSGEGGTAAALASGDKQKAAALATGDEAVAGAATGKNCAGAFAKSKPDLKTPELPKTPSVDKQNPQCV